MARPPRPVLPPLALATLLLAAIAMRDGAPTAAEAAPDRPLPPPSPAAVPPDAGSWSSEGSGVALRTVALPPPGVPPAPSVTSPAGSRQGLPIPAPTVRPTAADGRRGLQLLDRIAGGGGPAIAIAWPGDPVVRQRLVSHLERCAGWRRMLLADGRLWRLEDPAGRPWLPAAGGRQSGVLRDLDGAAADREAVAALRARHHVAGGRPVAAVDRHWDALLLGGLARLAGPGWDGGSPAAGDLSARYVLDGGRLAVVDIRIAGRSLPGRVDLGSLSPCES